MKELSDRTMWLQMGFGRPILQVGTRAGLGLEGEAWSRLRLLSDFRFPVETVDYFFGAFLLWGDGISNWRARISHISSHDVDGKDTVVAGSSSKYSREFVEAMWQTPLWIDHNFLLTIGIRSYFHQVTKIEPWIAAPADLTWCFFRNSTREAGEQGRLLSWTRRTLNLFVSSDSGPVFPSLATGFRFEQSAEHLGTSDLICYYYYGASWAGTDAGAKVSQLKLQLDVRGL
ncbi:MAG: hypothetical protein Q8922_07755 [Bacteroidota bacterium]|nr:hypothetical protein [Bacteroidota bacterium]MDP4233213.1 hypothetical protein [Bacteroidota bacterium]MDP4242168.1 hypothetical protein [Bacteroidota bacterium]MDP4287818.1 hypothetical protein [Bacteroidota bacterium]